MACSRFMFKTIASILFAFALTVCLAGQTRAMPRFQLDGSRNQTPKPETLGDPSYIKQSSKTSGRFSLDSIAVFQFTGFNGSDCWGWTSPDGEKYALMGVNEGIGIVRISTMEIVDTVLTSDNSCVWRDMATYGNYCYATSECGSGITVIDLSFLPDSAHLVNTFPSFVAPIGPDGYTSHNLSIDSVKGFLYIEGFGASNYNIHIFDISDPVAPNYVNSFGSQSSKGIHDLYALNDTVYVAEGFNQFYSIWNLGDKMEPSLITRWSAINPSFVHSIWPTADGRHVVTTEETDGATVKVWNIEDFDNVRPVSQFLGKSLLAHNARIRGDRVYVSHYASGVYVLDLSDPLCFRELANFDTWPVDDGSDYIGAWGVFAADDTLIYASNMDGKLYVLKLVEDSTIPETGDSDNDGLPDDCDNCPTLPNPLQVDIDFNGIGDICEARPQTPTIRDTLANEPILRWGGSSSPVVAGFDIFIKRIPDSLVLCHLTVLDTPAFAPEDRFITEPLGADSLVLSNLIDGAIYALGVAIRFGGDSLSEISDPLLLHYGIPRAPVFDENLFVTEDEKRFRYARMEETVSFDVWHDNSDIEFFKVYQTMVSDHFARTYIPPRMGSNFGPCATPPVGVEIMCDTLLGDTLSICITGITTFLMIDPTSTGEINFPVDSASKFLYAVTVVDSAGNESKPSALFTIFTRPSEPEGIAILVRDTRGATIKYDSIATFLESHLADYNPKLFDLIERRERGLGWPPLFHELGNFEYVLVNDPYKGGHLVPDVAWPSGYFINFEDLTKNGMTFIYIGNALGYSLGSDTRSTLILSDFRPLSLAQSLMGVDSTIVTGKETHDVFNPDTLFHYFDPIGSIPAPGSPFPPVTYHHSGFNSAPLNIGPIPFKGIMTPVSENVEVLYTYISGRDPVSFFHGRVTGIKYTAETHTAYTFLMAPWEFEPEQAVEFFRVLFGDIQTDVDDDPNAEILPKTFALAQNYPNPFNPATMISFSLPNKAQVSLTIYNILGQQVATLVNGELPAGEHSVTWNAARFASGIYFYSLKAGQTRLTRKALLVK